MLKRTRWILAGVIGLTIFSILSVTAASNIVFLPAVYQSPPFSATPTPTATPTVTPTPQAGVFITHVEMDPSGPDIENEHVIIRNETNQTVDMSDWVLRDNTSTAFTFPDNFRLGTNQTVKVWTRAETDEDEENGTDATYELFWGLSSPVWDNFKDCAFLYDDDGRLVDEFCYERTP